MKLLLRQIAKFTTPLFVLAGWAFGAQMSPHANPHQSPALAICILSLLSACAFGVFQLASQPNSDPSIVPLYEWGVYGLYVLSLAFFIGAVAYVVAS